MKRIFLSDQDVETIIADYNVMLLQYNEEKNGEGLSIDIEKQFDNDGYIIGVRLNFADDSGNIVTGYQETYGVYGEKFYEPVHYQDGEGGVFYATKIEDVPQLRQAVPLTYEEIVNGWTEYANINS